MKTILNTKSILHSLLLFPVATFAAAETGVKDSTPARPNVLFISVDDLRTALGCYGDPLAISPNIDRLAAEGRLFQHAYTQQAVCGPSRATLFTGRLPDHTRVWHNRNLFRDTLPDLVTMPQVFMANGYHAQSMGKTFSGNPREEDPQSWSVPFVVKAPGWRNYLLDRDTGGKGNAYEAADVPDNGYPDGKLTDLAVQTLTDLKEKEQPFFLAVGYFKPHLPFNAPKKYWDLYDPSVFDMEEQAPRVKDAPGQAYHEHRELGGYKDMPKNEKVSPEQARALRHGYYACVSYIDAQVGRLLDTLKELGLEDNTIVVLWGDHGFSLGEASRWCKGTNFELDTRVPLMVRLPGMAKPGAAAAGMVELVDIYPTLAELAGLTPPADLDGSSFAALLKDPAQPGRDIVLSQFARPFKRSDPEVMGYSVRTSTHRYSRWIDWPTGKVLGEELYDYADASSVLHTDAYWIEKANLAGDPANAKLLERMRGKMDEVLTERTGKPAGKAAQPKKEKKKNKQAA
jgi:iduronate 2-sulfatase